MSSDADKHASLNILLIVNPFLCVNSTLTCTTNSLIDNTLSSKQIYPKLTAHTHITNMLKSI